MRLDIRIDLDGGGWLRTLVAEDVTVAYVDGLNDPAVNEFLVGPRTQRQTLSSVRDFVTVNERDPAGLLFGLYVEAMLRGTSRLHDIDLAAGTAFIGIALFDKSVWGQGWGSKMIEAICRYAAAHWGICNLRAGIDERNVRSQRAFARAGFMPGHELRNGHDGSSIRYWSRSMHDAPASAKTAIA